MLIATGNEKLQFSHARLRKAFTLPYLLELLGSTDCFDDRQNDQEITGIEDPHPEDGSLNTLKSDELIRPTPEQMGCIRDKLVELMSVIYLESDNRVLAEWNKYNDLVCALLVREQRKIMNLSGENPLVFAYITYLFDVFIPFLTTYVEKVLGSQDSDFTEKVDIQHFHNIVQSIFAKVAGLQRCPKELAVDSLATLAKSLNNDQAYQNLIDEKLEEIKAKQAESQEIEFKRAASLRKPTHLAPSEKETMKETWRRFVNLFVNSKFYEKVSRKLCLMSLINLHRKWKTKVLR